MCLDSWASNHRSTNSWMLLLVYTGRVSLSYRCDDAELQRMTGSKAIQCPPSQEKQKKTSRKVNTSVCFTVLNTDIARLVTSYSRSIDDLIRPRHELETCQRPFSASCICGYLEMWEQPVRHNTELKETNKAPPPPTHTHTLPL